MLKSSHFFIPFLHPTISHDHGVQIHGILSLMKTSPNGDLRWCPGHPSLFFSAFHWNFRSLGTSEENGAASAGTVQLQFMAVRACCQKITFLQCFHNFSYSYIGRYHPIRIHRTKRNRGTDVFCGAMWLPKSHMIGRPDPSRFWKRLWGYRESSRQGRYGLVR